MRELQDYELENVYGGGIITSITMLVGAVIAAVAAYKLVSAENAKIKLPGGTDISFEGSKSRSSPKSRSQPAVKTTSLSSPKTSSKSITLNQLDNTQKTFSSTPRNFLVQI